MRLSTLRARVVAVAGTILAVLPFLIATPSSAAPSAAEVERAQARLLELERDFQLTSERYNLVRSRLSALQAQIGAAAQEVDTLERRMVSTQDQAIEVARALYKGGSTMAVEAVLSSESVTEMESRVAYMAVSRSQQTAVFETLGSERSTLEATIAELEIASEKVVSHQAELEALRAEADAKVAEQRAEIDHLNDLIERARRQELARALAGVIFDPGTSLEANPEPATNPRAQAAVDAALSQLGKPYVWAADGPDSYDCSGLTMWAWAHASVSLPHYSGAQYDITERISRSQIEPGDLIFFGAPIHHVGMYIGNGQMVEAPYTGSVVRINRAFRGDLVGIGRPH